MGDNGLDGISIGDRATDLGEDDGEIEQLLNELNVENLSDLSEKQAQELANALGGEEELEGISTSVNGGDRQRRNVAARARQAAQAQQQEVFEKQLSQLQEIDDNTQLLQQISAGVSTTNDLLRTANSILSDVVESNIRGAALAVKDSNQVEFDKSNSSKKVVEDDNITTSTVLVKTNPKNEGDLFLGGGSVQVGSGYRMEAGERETFQVDVLETTFEAVSEESGDQYTYIAFGSSNN